MVFTQIGHECQSYPGDAAKTKAATRIWHVKDLSSVQQMFRQKLLRPWLFPTSLNLWSFYFPSFIRALVSCTQRDWQLHVLLLMTTIPPLNLTSDSWVSSKKTITNAQGQMPWKMQVAVEAIPHSLNWKEVSSTWEKCSHQSLLKSLVESYLFCGSS